jgi:hypothetical protein
VKRKIADLRRFVRASRWMAPLLLVPALVIPSPRARARADSEPSQAEPAAPPVASPRIVEMGASWAEYYRSMSELKAHADMAVVGTVSSIAPAIRPQGAPVYQMVTVTVERTSWAGAHGTSAPSSVTFEQTGGTYQGVTYQVDDDPPFHVGDRAVLFFTEYSPGKYRVTGGPTGRFGIVGGKVRPTVGDGVQVAPGTSESAFTATL